MIKHVDQTVARFWTAAKAEKERFDRERAEYPATYLSDNTDFCDVKDFLDAVVFAVAQMSAECGLGRGSRSGEWHRTASSLLSRANAGAAS